VQYTGPGPRLQDADPTDARRGSDRAEGPGLHGEPSVGEWGRSGSAESRAWPVSAAAGRASWAWASSAGVKGMRRRWVGIVRLLCVLALIVMASLGAVAALTGLGPRRLLELTPAGRGPSGQSPAPARRAGPRDIPLYSDFWVDDSGIS